MGWFRRREPEDSTCLGCGTGVPAGDVLCEDCVHDVLRDGDR